MTAALVIARGGSVRLPRKNVRPFCGIPLVAWSIIQAKYSYLVDWVFLSTDDDEIEDIGRQYGAEIIRRPDWPDANQVSAPRVYVHALDEMDARGYDIGRFVTLLPTSPLRLPSDIDRAIEKHICTGSRIVPLARPRETVIYRDVASMTARMVIRDKDGVYMMSNSGLADVYFPSWFRWYYELTTAASGEHDKQTDALASDIYNNPDTDSYYIETQPWQCTEADTLAEFNLAEVLMEHYILQGRGEAVYHDYARRKL